MTQEEIDARIAASNAKKGPKAEAIDNTALVEAFRQAGGRVLHVPPLQRRKGITFAYKLKGTRIELSSALTHTVDTFAKKIGTKTAIDHFEAGKTITLPVPRGHRITDYLRYYVAA